MCVAIVTTRLASMRSCRRVTELFAKNALLSLVQYQCQGDDAGAQNDGGGAEEAQHKELSVGYHVFI